MGLIDYIFKLGKLPKTSRGGGYAFFGGGVDRFQQIWGGSRPNPPIWGGGTKSIDFGGGVDIFLLGLGGVLTFFIRFGGE